MSLEYIRNNYGVPAFKGTKVKYNGIEAIITGANGKYLILKFDDKTKNGLYHPTWNIIY